MKIIIPEHLVTEIINKDLSYIEGDQKLPQTEITVGKIQKSGTQMTTDDFARQSAQYNPSYYGGAYIREQDETSEIANLDVLDALNQRGLKQVVNTLTHNFQTVPDDNKSEAIAISLKYILSQIKWDEIDDNYKNEIRNLVV